MMVEQKSISTKRNNGQNSRQIKPSRYIDMVVEALQSLKNKEGAIPKRIVSYISKAYNLENDKKTIFNGVYRALKQGIEMDLFQRNTYGRFKVTAKAGKQRKVPSRKRRKGRKRGRKKRKGRRRKKGRKKGKRRKSRRRRKKSRRRKKVFDEQEDPKRHRRKQHDDHDDPKKRRRKPHEVPDEQRRRRRKADDQDEPKKRRPRKKENE